MINFWLQFPTAVPATTTQLSQHSNVMTSPVLFSMGNQNYFLAPVRYEPYLYQWHSGGVGRVTPHWPVPGNTAPESRESDVGTAPETGERETTTETLSHKQGVATQNRILTQNQSECAQALSEIETDVSVAADFEMSETAIQRRRRAQGSTAYKPRKSFKELTQSQLDNIQARLGKEPDASIAADFEISNNVIYRCRHTQGIAAYKPHKPHKPHKSHKKLTQSQLDSVQMRLGSESDASIAADFGVSKATIQSHRNAHGIAAYESHKVLTQCELDSIQARLGKEPDTSIAADFEISRTTIQKRRSAQGITAYLSYDLHKKLTRNQLDSAQTRLGSEPDASIAADLGVSRAVIQKRRSKQGIAAYKPYKFSKKLTQSQLNRINARLGKETDARIAADFGVSEGVTRKRRNARVIAASKLRKPYTKLTQSQLDSVQGRLGKEPDASIAADLGVITNTIQKRRNAQGIVAYEPHKSFDTLTKSQLDSIQARLGKEPDARIAADFGMSEAAIRKLRSAQGILAFQPHKSFY